MWGKWIWIAEIVFLFFVGYLLWGQSTGAGDAVHFLRDGIGARACGMGGAFVAIANDSTASYWNPAGLIQSPSIRLGGIYESRYRGLVETQCLTGIVALPSIGGGLFWLASDLYSVYSLALAGRIGNLSLGVAGKAYHFSEGLESASGMGFDFGGLYRSSLEGAEIAIGLVSSDIGWSAIHWRATGVEATDYAAWVWRLGVAYSSPVRYGQWTWAASMEVAFKRPPLPGERDYLARALQFNIMAGMEVWIGNLALRVGVKDFSFGGVSGISARPTAGLGVELDKLVFDAAWTISELGDTYILSIETKI